MAFFKGSKYAYLVVFAVDISAFLTGTALAWSSPMIATLKSSDITKIPLGRQITQNEESWIGSLSAMGGIFGPPIFCYLFQTMGRKWANTLTVLPYLIAYLIAAFAEEVWLFYISRIFMGAALGGVFSIVTVYAVEVSEDVNRGILSSSITVFIQAGLLFAYSVGPYASIMVFNLILSGICIAYFPIFMYIAPETPLYLVSQNKDEEALKSLRYLRRRTSQEHRKEMEEIKKYLEDLKPGTFSDIFKTRASIKALLYSIILTTFQQFSGINVILFFTQDIFDASGSEIPSEICSIIVAAVQFVASFGTSLGADRFGRRRLLLVAIIGSTLAEIVLGVYFYLKNNGGDVSGVGWLPVLSLVVFITFYNFGMGALPWVIMSEILPSNVVSKAAALTTSFYWFSGFFLTRYFADLCEGIGMAGSFWVFSGFGILFLGFVYFFMFETNGRSKTEIQEILSR